MTRALWKRLANRARDIAYLSPFDRPARSRSLGSLTILLYHRVAAMGDSPHLDEFGAPPIEPVQLRRELSFLRTRGYKFVDPNEFLREGFRPDAEARSVLITFDDGLVDTYTVALPIVESVGARAIVFQVASLVDSVSPLWEHELYWHYFRLGRRSETLRERLSYLRENLTPAQISEHLQVMRDQLSDAARENLQYEASRLYPSSSALVSAQLRGHVIGSHGNRHFKRANLDNGLFAEELRLSKAVLSEVVDQEVTAFSYPFNSFQNGDHRLVREHFRHVFTVHDGADLPESDQGVFPRFTWTGPHKNVLRERRWLHSGRI